MTKKPVITIQPRDNFSGWKKHNIGGEEEDGGELKARFCKLSQRSKFK